MSRRRIKVAQKWNSSEALERVDVFPPASGKFWTFASSKVSGMFESVLGPDWSAMVYAPYFADWWAPILKQLEGWAHYPVEITLSLRYRYGLYDEKDAFAALGIWRTEGLTIVGDTRNPILGNDLSGEGETYVMATVASHGEEGKLLVTMATLLGFELKPLTAVT